MALHRRPLLRASAALLAAGVAGCTGETNRTGAAEAPTARLEMTPAGEVDLPARVLYTTHAEGTPTDRSRLLDRVLDGDRSVEATRPPLPVDEPVLHDDAVYDLSRETVDRTAATTFSVLVDVPGASPDPATTVAFADLPAVDREAFRSAGLADGDLVGVGTTVLYTDAGVERSVLVPDSEYDHVEWADGTRAEWAVEDRYDTPLYTYRYGAERRRSAADYAAAMRERFTFAPADLSEDERAVLSAAADAGTYVLGPDATPTPGVRSLTDRLRDREAVHALHEEPDPAASGSYLLRYDGTVYWTRFVVERTERSTDDEN